MPDTSLEQIKNSLAKFYSGAPQRTNPNMVTELAKGYGESYGVALLDNAANGAGAVGLQAFNVAKFISDRFKHLRVRDELNTREYEAAYRAIYGDYVDNVDFLKIKREMEESDTVNIVDALYLAGKTRYSSYQTWKSLEPKVSTTRGFLVPATDFEKPTPDYSRALVFQFNPTEITDGKSVKWEERPYTGHDGSREIWGYGGRRTLKFKLEFDASMITQDVESLPTDYLKMGYKVHTNKRVGEAVENIDYYSVTEQDGTLTPVSRLQSYRYSEPLNKTKARFKNGLFEPTNRFSSPPVLYFVFGKMVFAGVIETADVTHSLFHKKGFPIRSSCDVSFIVYEWNVSSNISDDTLQKLSNTTNLLTGIANKKSSAIDLFKISLTVPIIQSAV